MSTTAAPVIPSAQPPAVEVTDLRPLGSGARHWRICGYILKSRRLQILTGVACVLALAVAVFLVPKLRPPGEFVAPAADWLSWQGNLQTLFGLATFLVAIMVWYNTLSEEWAKRQPLLLTAYFFCKDYPVLICYHAYLAGEADIRAWSQQICGRQMAGGDLKFRPVVETRTPEFLTDGESVYVHHQTRFALTELPAKLKVPDHGEPTFCLVWQPRKEALPPETSSGIPIAQARNLPGVADWSGSCR